MRKLYLILLGFILPFFHSIHAQEMRMMVVKPVSPSAAGIFKTLERPIGSNTGTVTVNFPLFKISSGSLETSISLDYNNTGGIKVEELATNVGLGFNLAAGGRITRIQKGGISDDEPGIGYLANSVKPSQIQMSNSNHLIRIQRKNIDLEPDIFMYNFNGESGKFFFNESGQVIMMQESKVKVQYFTDAGGIKSWVLHDCDGNKYHFTLKEYTTSSYQNYGSDNIPSETSYASSWLLTEIRDINNQNPITFSYQQSTSGFFTLSGGNQKIQALIYATCDPEYFDERVVVYTKTSEYILSKITGSSGYVSFSSSNNRLDINGGSKLTDLTLYDHNNTRLKKCHFNYDYFVNGDALGTPSNNHNYYRLKLKSFSELGENNTDSLNYSFTYNEREHLPQRLSYAVDYWGYYNGQVYNSSPLPNVTSTYYGQTIRLSNFSNKEVVSGCAEAGILTKITYPTGGSREFIYEGNTALLTSDSQIAPAPDSIVAQEIMRTDFSNVSYPGPCLKQTFKINSNDGGAIFSYVLFRGNLCGNFSVRIYAISSLDDEWGGNLLYTYENEQSWSRSLNNGMYRLEVYKSGPGCNFSNLQLNWEESIFVHENVTTPYGIFTKINRAVGGVRIKEIRDYDPVSAKTLSTKYLYKLYSTDSTLTSGVLNTPVRVMNEFNTDCSGCRYMLLYTSSCYPLASDGGSFVVYPEVRTIEEGNGWTDRLYTYSPDVLESEFEYPILPLSTEPAKLRGKLLSEKTYANGGNLLNENSFFYEPIFLPGPGYSASGAVVKLFYSRVVNSIYMPCMEYGNSPTIGPTNGKIKYQDLSGIIYGLAGKSEKKYYSNGSYVETKTSYAYDTDGIGHPMIKQTLITGDGKTRETNYRYSFNDLSDFKFKLSSKEQTFKSVLLDSNYLQPLEITHAVTYPNAAPIFQGGAKYSFNRFNGVELNIGNVKEYTSNTDYKETVFSAYQNGRLLEKYTVGGPKEVYLWGYNDQYPVAKVTGRDYNTLTGWFSPSILYNPASDVQLQTNLAAIRNNLSSEPGQVETYSYKRGVGMTSQVDPKGMTTYYEYDAFQRLKYIKDQNGNIIKSYYYHYKP